eukprot:241589_1
MAVNSFDSFYSIFILVYVFRLFPKFLWYFGYMEFANKKGKVESNAEFQLGFEMNSPRLFIILHVSSAVLLCIFWILLLMEIIVISSWTVLFVSMGFIIITLPFITNLIHFEWQNAVALNCITLAWILIFNILYIYYDEKLYLRLQCGQIAIQALLDVLQCICFHRKQSEPIIQRVEQVYVF